MCRNCASRAQAAERTATMGSGQWPSWGIALISFVCNPLFITSIMAFLRAREELTLAATLEVSGDTQRASDLRTQAWIGIVLASLLPVTVCVCFGFALVMNIVGAAAGGGSGYNGY